MRFLKYLNVMVLAVFVWVNIPVSFSHDLLANHHDDDQTDCLLHHKHLGVHVEKLSSHCGLFDFESPVFDTPQIIHFSKGEDILLSEISFQIKSVYSKSFYLKLSGRGPPQYA